MNKPRHVVILLILAALLLLYGCGTASMANMKLVPVAIPPTPTASTGVREVSVDSEPAFALLKEAQKAMQNIHSYYFEQDNSTDTHISETNQVMAVPRFLMQLEGQATPPIARYHGKQGSDQFEYVLIGKNAYHLASGNNGYALVSDTDIIYNPFLVTAALSNPQEYINLTLDTAKCATIAGDEKIAGVVTTRLRFVLPRDAIGMRGQGHGSYMYGRDIWIDKDTHVLRQLQIIETFSTARSCKDALTADPSIINYTSALLTYARHNEPIVPPLEAPLERIPVTP